MEKNTMNKKTLAVISISLLLLTGCGETPTTDTTPVTPPATTQPAPEPTNTEPVETDTTPEVTGALRDENGEIIFPDGTIAECPEESKGAIKTEDGTIECDTGLEW